MVGTRASLLHRFFGFSGVASASVVAMALGAAGCQSTNDVQPTIASAPPRPTSPPVEPPPDELVPTKTQKARAIYNMANRYYDNKDYTVALNEYKRALDVDGDYFRAYSKIGLCYYAQQKYDAEILYYERCLEICPTFTEALKNLANALLARDDVEKALRYYEKLLVIEPEHGVALFNSALINLDLEQPAVAKARLKKFISLYPNDPLIAKAKLHLAEAEKMVEDKEERDRLQR